MTMQDRFSFRVWDKKHKTYDCLPYGSNALAENGELFWKREDDDCIELDEEYYIVEQCTGLKDKNGKLIFEGDIVFVNGENWRVIWSDEDCAFFFSNLKEVCYQLIFPDFYAMDEDFKVIGNIHTDKNLLEFS